MHFIKEEGAQAGERRAWRIRGDEFPMRRCPGCSRTRGEEIGLAFGVFNIESFYVATDTTFLQSIDFIKIKMLLTSQLMHL